MKSIPCPRGFEVDAARDGRLTGAERARFDRHLTTCAACASAMEVLDAAVSSLRAEQTSHHDELHARRERTRLLATFDRELVASGPGRRTRAAWLFLPAVAVALVAALLLFRRTAVDRSHGAVTPVEPSNAVVRADETAVWSKSSAGDRDRVHLVRGTLWIHVDHARGERRLLVELPDGELEDVGTTFTVSAENGRTTRVAVEDGRVVLRVRGRPPATLAPGETWVAEQPAATTPTSSSPAPTAPTDPQSDTSRGTPPPPVTDASSEFRAAMEALHAGDTTRAAGAFAAFTIAHPRDPRAEDAAYLRVIAFQRSGDEPRMQRAARDYLRRYAAGFRRAEVEPLAR